MHLTIIAMHCINSDFITCNSEVILDFYKCNVIYAVIVNTVGGRQEKRDASTSIVTVQHSWNADV